MFFSLSFPILKCLLHIFRNLLEACKINFDTFPFNPDIDSLLRGKSWPMELLYDTIFLNTRFVVFVEETNWPPIYNKSPSDASIEYTVDPRGNCSNQEKKISKTKQNCS